MTPKTSDEGLVDDAQGQLREATAALTTAIEEFTNNPQATSSDRDKLQRKRIIDTAARIQEIVKDPADQWLDMIQSVTIIAVNRLFSEWGVFDTIPLDGSISYVDIAAKVNADAGLIERLARILISAEVLQQVGPHDVAHTDKSRMFLKGEKGGLVYNLGWDNWMISSAAMPRYFEVYGRKEPQGPTHVPITFAYGYPDLSYYEMISRDPEKLQRFMPAMAALEEKMPMAGIYDFTWLVKLGQKENESDRKAFVDVGGGKGHVIKAIAKEFPGLPLDRFVLQDRPETIEAVNRLDEPELVHVEKQEVDFNVEQPVKGAHVYWIRRCLHNYSDTVSANILKVIARSMADDSKLLISEDVLEESHEIMGPVMDFIMLIFGGKQRTLKNWEKLCAEAGLQISGISRSKGPWRTMSVIECVRTT